MGSLMIDMSRLGLVLLCGALVLLWYTDVPGKPLTVEHGDDTWRPHDLAGVIEQAMHKHRVTRLSIAVGDDQQVVWAQGFGYADASNHIPFPLS